MSGIDLIPNAKHLLLDVFEPNHSHNCINDRVLYAIERLLDCHSSRAADGFGTMGFVADSVLLGMLGRLRRVS